MDILAQVKVSEEDLDLLSAYKWKLNNKGYVKAVYRINGRQEYLHKLIADRLGMNRWNVIDHINGNPLDNRRDNLRECTRQQNAANRSKPRNNTTGYKGVSIDKRRKTNPYKAVIMVKGQYMSLGQYKTARLAAQAYDIAAIELFGEYAKTNKALGLLK